MLNKKSNFFLKLFLGAFILTVITITGCNNEGESKSASSEGSKKTEVAADTSAKKSDTTQRPIIPGGAPEEAK